MINDFKHYSSFVDFQQYGTMKIYDAGKFGLPAQRQTKEDGIHIFLNFKKVYFFKTNDEAQEKIKELLLKAPSDLSDFNDYLFLK